MTEQRKSLGMLGEEVACAHLRDRGYRILTRNYRVRQGEMDIVADDRGTLVFVEVKARRGSSSGTALEAVTPRKQRQLSMVALEYMSRHGCHGLPARFDVVGVEFGPEMAGSRPLLVEVVRDAFELCYGL